MSDSYGGHYYIAVGDASALEAAMRRMRECIERAGPQLIHFHRLGEDCRLFRHRRCDATGQQDIRLGGYVG